MLYFDKQETGWRLSVWHVTETLDELLSILPDDLTVRAQAEKQFKSPKRILEWVAVRVLLYTMMGRQLTIHYHDNGAPFLSEYEHLDISISHTTGYVAVALSESRHVGIDVEQISSKVRQVRDRFVRPDESADTLVKLLLHWSAKETAYKILQRDRIDFLKNLRVLPFSEREEGVFWLAENRTDEEHKMEISYRVFPDFVLTYAFL